MSHPLVRPYLTYEDLSRLPADGHRYELFDGEAYMSPSPTLRHQKVLGNLYVAFRAGLRGDAEVFIAPLDVVLAPATALQPDLLVVLGENARIKADVIRGVPDLIVEVLSPSTADLDKGLKMETYTRHGVPEYWLADPEDGRMDVYRLDLRAGSYRHVATYQRGDRATTPLLPGLVIDAAEIFG
jgi:Uma2 family endonuclease